MMDNVSGRTATFRDGRPYGVCMFNGVNAPNSSYLYSQFPMQGFPFPLCKLTDTKNTFSDFSKGGIIHHKHCSPVDGNNPVMADFTRSTTGGSSTACHASSYSSRELGRDAEMKQETLEGVVHSIGMSSRKHSFTSLAQEQQRETGKEQSSLAEEHLSHQHYSVGISSNGRKTLMSSPQSPLKSDCQPNSPTESSSSKNAALAQASQPPTSQGTQDPKARNWKKYKFIVLNQSSKEEEANPRDPGMHSPPRPGLSAFLHHVDSEHPDSKATTKISEQSEDFTVPQASRLNNIINRWVDYGNFLTFEKVSFCSMYTETNYKISFPNAIKFRTAGLYFVKRFSTHHLHKARLNFSSSIPILLKHTEDLPLSRNVWNSFNIL